jgi:hypothetical protein
LTTHDLDEREAAFQSYLATTVHYFETVEAAGDKPWFDSVEERRELFMRRYQKPDPPEGVPARTLAEIRGSTPITTHIKDAA